MKDATSALSPGTVGAQSATVGDAATAGPVRR